MMRNLVAHPCAGPEPPAVNRLFNDLKNFVMTTPTTTPMSKAAEAEVLPPEALVDTTTMLTIPLVAEQLDIQVRTVESGRVHIGTHVVETQQSVDQPLRRDEVEIERIPINRVVERPMPTRVENDVTIVPIYEETLVVTKQLVLKEEVHIRRRVSIDPAPAQIFSLRREEVTISRNPAGRAD
jgi:uncharacterized protein (TIGR02271 family)